MLNLYKTNASSRLLSATALVLILSQGAVVAQERNCDLVNGVLPADCRRADANTVVTIPVGENTELARPAKLRDTGFSISVDGVPVSGDKRLADKLRKTDLALAAADVQVRFDGLGAKQRLTLVTVGANKVFHSGERVIFESQTNYPNWLNRGEVRIVDLDAKGGARTVAVLPVDPNGRVQFVMPAKGELVAVHRVYDAKGRYDETAAVALSRRSVAKQAPDDLFQDTPEEGVDTAVRRRIPVHGGSITISGTSVAPGARVQVMGETLRADASGRFVLNRIVPVGTHAVPVKITGSGQNIGLVRDIVIPRSEWFYVGIADVTAGIKKDRTSGVKEHYDHGRLAFYAKGRTQRGYTITASVDSGEEKIGDLLRKIDERDPRSLLRRLDPDDLYPTYGDDSTLVEDAPTSGKFYLKIEKDNNSFLWGDYRAQVSGGHFLRNERTLYGARAKWESQATTTEGDARVAVSLYAAQPDHLPQRDVFRGTGGSVYFLKRQDIAIGSETLSIEIRDADTGRVLERRTLVEGEDYQINYIQGVITLTRPLNSSAGGGLIVTTPSGEQNVNLVAQYEFTPTAGAPDGYVYGGRVESWVTDKLRVGATGMVEKTGTADQKAISADILYRHSEGTWAKLDYAKTSGPGFGSTLSTDGGLIIDTPTVASGNGHAVYAEVRLDFADTGITGDGAFGAYYEHRTQGFSTLDYQVLATTGAETLWGVNATGTANDRLSWKLYYDDYRNAVGEYKREGGIELKFKQSDTMAYEVGVEHVDRNAGTEIGSRTDVALRLNMTPNEQFNWYVFGQATLQNRGLSRNNRIGAGLSYDFANGWAVEGEVSDGNLGAGARLMASYQKGDDRSLYFGYELAPGRDMVGTPATGRDRGRFVMGGRRRINDSLLAFGENSYDLFSDHKSLTSAYGVEYAHSDSTTYTAAFEYGQVDDPVNGDLTRQALTFGMLYHDDRLEAQGRIELRRERGAGVGGGAVTRDTDSYLLSASARYKISEEQRLLVDFEAARTDGLAGATQGGDLVDFTLGYAYRPIDNDRLNILLRYRYLYDMYGQVVTTPVAPATTADRARQISHVFSIDADYDLNERWSLGGKLGFRLSETSPDQTTALARNDALLGVLNLRYHLVHNWDLLAEARMFKARQAGTTDTGFLAAAYRHVGNNVKLGVGYNFTRFSDDLTNLSNDNDGFFVNLIAKF